MRLGDGLWVRLVDVGAALSRRGLTGDGRAAGDRGRGRVLPVEPGPLPDRRRGRGAHRGGARPRARRRRARLLPTWGASASRSSRWPAGWRSGRPARSGAPTRSCEGIGRRGARRSSEAGQGLPRRLDLDDVCLVPAGHHGARARHARPRVVDQPQPQAPRSVPVGLEWARSATGSARRWRSTLPCAVWTRTGAPSTVPPNRRRLEHLARVALPRRAPSSGSAPTRARWHAEDVHVVRPADGCPSSARRGRSGWRRRPESLGSTSSPGLGRRGADGERCRCRRRSRG